MLIVVGGALYTFGGVVYGFKRPNPWPRWFGFHEVFHSFTILAFVTHYVGVSLATYCAALRPRRGAVGAQPRASRTAVATPPLLWVATERCASNQLDPDHSC